jgi:hypothetical protein
VYDFHAIVSENFSVEQQDTDLERRVAAIQRQLEHLSSAVDLPAEQREHAAAVEERLSLLSQQCAEILDRWTLTDLRHARALGEMEARLHEWERLETRVEQGAHDRLHQLEQKIENEWKELRQVLEQPVKQLQEHAASLRETSVATAGSALSGLERAESRLSTIQADIAERMGQLSHEVQAAMAELRSGVARPGQNRGGGESWPLDEVMRLHNEMRDTPEGASPDEVQSLRVRRPGGPDRRRESRAVELIPESGESLSSRIESVELAEHKDRSMLRLAVGLVVVALVLSAIFGIRVQRQVAAASEQTSEALRQAEAARALAAREIAASRLEADQRMAESQETARRSQIVSDVLVAPDLVRYGLSGGETTPDARGQLLWSRSRGIVISGSRVPAPPSGYTYQFWLFTGSGAISAALATPDTQGRISVATDLLPSVPRPVIGAALTLEPRGGSPAPSGAAVLSYRAQ